MEILKSILKVFGFIAILLLIIIPATTGTLLGIRFGAERHNEAANQTTAMTTNTHNGDSKTISLREAERAKAIAQKEADKAKAELIREQRKADRQYYLMNFPWGDLILIILCVIFTIGCIIYIIRN